VTTGTPERLTLDEVRGRPERVVAGLMTGTSLDGIDVALCRVTGGPGRPPQLLGLVAAEAYPFAPGLRDRLLAAATGGAIAGEIARLGRDLGLAYADAVADLAAKAGARVELVGSHGQTVHHEHGVSTLQIGEPAYLALRLGCPVVADFRQGDVAAGGCGAPLAPIIDSWLLRRPGAGVLALNLGGISNFTALPPEGDPAPVVGLDCGPANMVMDGLVHRLTGGREAYDRDGRLAARGRVDQALLAELLADSVFAQAPPRSLGREQFGQPYLDRLLAKRPPAGEQDWCDLLATAAELTARAVADAYARFAASRIPVAEVVAAGGGARNPELMRRLALAFDPMPVVTSDARGLPADFKEAILFALLASARVDGVPGNLPEVTGAARPVLLGKVVEC